MSLAQRVVRAPARRLTQAHAFRRYLNSCMLVPVDSDGRLTSVRFADSRITEGAGAGGHVGKVYSY